MDRKLQLLLVTALATIGGFLVASGVQGPGQTNWFGQWCVGGYPAVGCVRAEWFGLGAGCLVGAFLLYRHK